MLNGNYEIVIRLNEMPPVRSLSGWLVKRVIVMSSVKGRQMGS